MATINILIIVTLKVSENDLKLWGVKELNNDKFNTEILDISILNHKSSLNIDNSAIVKIKKFQEFDEYLNKADFVFVNTPQIYLTFKLLRFIYKRKDVFFLKLSNGFIPEPVLNRTLFRKIKNLLRRPSTLINKIKYKYFLKNDYEFIAGEAFFKRNAIKIPSFEYHQYSNFLQRRITENSEESILFIDSNLPFHRDFKVLGVKINNPTEYFNNLSNFFKYIEEKTKKRVVIAAHPRAKYLDNYFEGREVIKDNTLELISRSSIVLSHYSTATNYAVLLKKKIVLLTTNILDEQIGGQVIKQMGQELGVPIVNLDSAYEINFTELLVSHLKYDQYINRYMKSNTLENNDIWEIVKENLFKIKFQNIKV